MRKKEKKDQGLNVQKRAETLDWLLMGGEGLGSTWAKASAPKGQMEHHHGHYFNLLKRLKLTSSAESFSHQEGAFGSALLKMFKIFFP